MCRSDEEWTRLLKEGPGENARLFVDYFLVRLPAKEVVRRFAHEGLRLSTPRAAGLFFLSRAPHCGIRARRRNSGRERPRVCCRLVRENGRSLLRAARPRVRDGGTWPRATHFFPAHFFFCHALAPPRGLGDLPAPARPCLGEHAELFTLRVRR